jgi:hypothetical protein
MPEDQPQIPAQQQPPELQSNITPAGTQPPPVGKSSYGAQLVLGLGSFVLLGVGIGSLLLLGGLRPPGYLPWLVLPLSVIGLGVYVLVRRAGCGPGLWVGFLIGLGLVGLAFGLCFAGMAAMG